MCAKVVSITLAKQAPKSASLNSNEMQFSVSARSSNTARSQINISAFRCKDLLQAILEKQV